MSDLSNSQMDKDEESGYRDTVPEQRQNSGTAPAPKSKRGFASMDRARQREIASRGGRAAHEKGVAHRWSSEEAKNAGRKGGTAAHEKGRAHQWTSDEARNAGRKGGMSKSTDDEAS
jgi:general stress protein YciG